MVRAKGDRPDRDVPKLERWKPVPCSRCDGCGFLSYTRLHRDRQHRFAYRCSCPNGDRLDPAIPRLDDAFPESRGAVQADLNVASAFTCDPGKDDVSMQRRGVAYLRSVFQPGSVLRQRMDVWADRAGIFRHEPEEAPF